MASRHHLSPISHSIRDQGTYRDKFIIEYIGAYVKLKSKASCLRLYRKRNHDANGLPP